MALGGGLPRAPTSRPPLARQLNEVYRQIPGSHKLQKTKFRCVLGAQGWVGELPQGPSGSRSPLCPPQAAAQRWEEVS